VTRGERDEESAGRCWLTLYLASATTERSPQQWPARLVGVGAAGDNGAHTTASLRVSLVSSAPMERTSGEIATPISTAPLPIPYSSGTGASHLREHQPRSRWVRLALAARPTADGLGAERLFGGKGCCGL
jgi:hypothetical protein